MGPAFDQQRMSLTDPTLPPARTKKRRKGRAGHHSGRSQRSARHWDSEVYEEYLISGHGRNISQSEYNKRRKRHSTNTNSWVDSDVMGISSSGNSTSTGQRHAKNLAKPEHRLKSKDKRSEFLANIRKPIWQCKMETKWRKMRDGIFPPFIQVGQCTQTTCMHGFYVCTPKKYVIKVLKRDKQRCVPLASLGETPEYEEVWTFASYKVTVACECTLKRRRRQRG